MRSQTPESRTTFRDFQRETHEEDARAEGLSLDKKKERGSSRDEMRRARTACRVLEMESYTGDMEAFNDF